MLDDFSLFPEAWGCAQGFNQLDGSYPHAPIGSGPSSWGKLGAGLYNQQFLAPFLQKKLEMVRTLWQLSGS